ncbi:MAG: M16 family metallopeptidase [Bosea sp. (in: a-proteobacteria)]
MNASHPMNVASPMKAPAANHSAVEVIRTPGGLDLWFARSPGLPLVVLDFACPGGASTDPHTMPGLSYFISAMLDEGAGHLNAEAFQAQLADHAISQRFDASRDEFRGTVRSLAKHRGKAFDLLRMAISQPHFEAQAVERVRGQILAGLRTELQSPEAICRDVFARNAFPGHSYGLPVKGTPEAVSAISSDHLKAHMPRLLVRDGLKIMLVADMTPDEAAAEIDAVFAYLPQASAHAAPRVSLAGLGRVFIEHMDVPQTVLRFAGAGLMRHDPDFIAATVVNHILGGSAFTSRLFMEVREKRGLAYGVSSSLMPYAALGLHVGGTATKNERAAESLDVIREEMAKLAANGPSAEEHDAAVKYLTGSYPLRFDTSGKIASEYLRVAMDGFAPDYVSKRNGLFHALTMDDLKRTATRLYGDGKLLVAAVGQPVGLV